MEISLSKSELKTFISSQLAYMLPDKYKFVGLDVDKAMELSLERLEFCFRHISIKGYNYHNNAYFYHLHSDQYCTFLYYLSNSLWQLSENKVLCDKLILLNRILHSVWFSYKTQLPNIFLLVHPVGSVFGNACYSDFFVAFQNVTVNTVEDGSGILKPVLGKGLYLGTGAKIIGNQPIGDRVTIGIDVCVYKRQILSDYTVYKDNTGKLIIKKSDKVAAAQDCFNVPII